MYYVGSLYTVCQYTITLPNIPVQLINYQNVNIKYFIFTGNN